MRKQKVWSLSFEKYMAYATATAKSLQWCPTLCDPIDVSPPGSPGPGILQARTLEWVAISFSSAWKWKMKVKSLSRVRLLATPWTATYQAPPSMGFSRQEHWSGVPLASPRAGKSSLQTQGIILGCFGCLKQRLAQSSSSDKHLLSVYISKDWKWIEF